MKKAVKLTLVVMLIIALQLVHAEVGIDYETKYGQAIAYDEGITYPGDIEVDGVFIHQTNDDYVVTVLYSGGVLNPVEDGDRTIAEASFYNPPLNDVIFINHWNESERLELIDSGIQFSVEKNLLEQVKEISISLFDVKYLGEDDNVIISFTTNQFDYDVIPQVDDLVSGYSIKPNDIQAELNTEPAEWAKKHIEELALEDILRDEAFTNFNQGITRQNFVYLMVELYEELTATSIKVDTSIQFDDTNDMYVVKAATIGITDGIGNNLFGPDIILNREQMTTFMIKTLQLAGVDLITDEAVGTFADDESISEWAKGFVNKAKVNEIMGGVGDNMFSPKTEASNEQVLYVTHSLMKKYGSLKWFNEFDKDRVYLKFGEDYYKLTLEKNILVSDSLEDTDLYLKDINDLDTIISVLLLQEKDLKFEVLKNPNVKGILEVHDYEVMSVLGKNLYVGVDKVGEVTTYDFGDDNYIPEVTVRFDLETIKYKDFDIVKYYDLAGERQKLETLSLDKIMKILEVDYNVSYHEAWNVYVIEIVEEE